MKVEFEINYQKYVLLRQALLRLYQQEKAGGYDYYEALIGPMFEEIGECVFRTRPDWTAAENEYIIKKEN